MKIACTLIAFLIIITIGCKKDEGGGTCSRTQLTRVKTNSSVNDFTIAYNADGTIKGSKDFPWTYFNQGQLMEYIGPTDTVMLDNTGRLWYLKKPFGMDGRRQTRYYFYDNLNRVVRTLTHTGNGADYMANLIYDNGDVVEMSYSINIQGPDTSRFKFTFYDTLCTDQHFGMQTWGQIGMTQNRHLMKTSKDFFGDSTHYDYKLDKDNRVLAQYRNYDNSGWTYARAVDTTYYEYSCP